MEPLGKRMIRQQITMELMKDEPNYELVQKLYKMIENPRKKVDNLMGEKEVNSNMANYAGCKGGKDHPRWKELDLTVEQYWEHKYNSLQDFEIADLVGCSRMKMSRWKKANGLGYKFKVGGLLKEEYIKFIDDGFSNEQICILTKMNWDTLEKKIIEWRIEK